MEKRRALGRGLQALIPEMTVDSTNILVADDREAIVQLNIAEIQPGRYQPRTAFNQDRLNELIASIRERGVVQPVLVRRTEAGYELIAGERRYRAVKSLGIEKIPAIIRQVDDANAMELALIENIQREDLNAIEEAKAYERLINEFSFNYDQIAQAVGKDRTSVVNIIRLLKLPAKIQKFVLDDILSMGHARALLSVTDLHKQMALCEKVIRKGLSVRETENLVKPHAAMRKTYAHKDIDPYSRAVEEDLQRVLGTKVIVQHGKKRGKLVIEYFSPADLDRIINIIKH